MDTNTTRKPDIDPTTLHRLYYEEGMTIKAIAALYGVCAATVRKHLGPVRKGPRPQAKGKNDAPQAVVAKKVQVPVQQAGPKQLIQSKIELKGRTAKFEVDLESGSLYARGAAFEMLLAKEEVELFIWELMEAYKAMSRRCFDVPGEQDVAEIVTDKLLLEELIAALDSLDPDEQALIDALFYCDHNECDYAFEVEITQQAVSKRKRKTIDKLKRIMGVDG